MLKKTKKPHNKQGLHFYRFELWHLVVEEGKNGCKRREGHLLTLSDGIYWSKDKRGSVQVLPLKAWDNLKKGCEERRNKMEIDEKY